MANKISCVVVIAVVKALLAVALLVAIANVKKTTLMTCG